MKKSILLACLLLAPAVIRAEDWPQWMGKNRDGIWREEGIVEKFPEGGPAILWTTALGSGYAGPAVANGKVYVMDRQLGGSADRPDNPFERGLIPGTERILCLDEADGRVLWTREYASDYTVSYAAGPRVTPTVEGDRVYTLGAEGDLLCLDAKQGSVIWERNFKKLCSIATPVWGFAAAPLIYQDLLICLAGGDGTTVLALDKMTGAEKWRALSAKEPGYCPPALIHHGGRDQLIIWHPESINSLDPLTGKVYWSLPWEIRSGLSVPTPRLDGDLLFFTAFYNGSTMLKLDPDLGAPTVLWQTQHVSEKRTTHLNAIMPTPVLKDGLIFGTCSYGELRCLDQQTGERIWESMEPSTKDGPKFRWFNNFLTPNAGRYILFSEEGNLIIAQLSREGYQEIDRAHVIEPDGSDMRQRPIVWSHPAYANGAAYIRNDSRIIKVDLKKQ